MLFVHNFLFHLLTDYKQFLFLCRSSQLGGIALDHGLHFHIIANGARRFDQTSGSAGKSNLSIL